MLPSFLARDKGAAATSALVFPAHTAWHCLVPTVLLDTLKGNDKGEGPSARASGIQAHVFCTLSKGSMAPSHGIHALGAPRKILPETKIARRPWGTAMVHS